MRLSNDRSHLVILGAGIAGLAAGYYARQAGIPFTIFESKKAVGGNCRTIERDGFRFDSGAHRFHDKDASQTRVMKSLLGNEFREVFTPSRIYYRGRYIAFPLRVFDLVRRIDPRFLFKAALEIPRARLIHEHGNGNFETLAIRTYGRTIAEHFLLGYSRKLWGITPRRLSPVVSGGRLKGLTPAALFRDAFGRSRSKARHLDGSFYYPAQGIEAIPESLAKACGRANILTGSRITRVIHDGRTVRAVEINGRELKAVRRVISTLPLTLFLGMLAPPLPDEINDLAGRLIYRNLLLCVLFLNTPSVSPCASIYFPDPAFPFSRIYEPKNRSRAMSPSDKTAIIAEYPCQPQDSIWNSPDDQIRRMTASHLARIGLIRAQDIIGGFVVRMEYAYPVIEIGAEKARCSIFCYLERFKNLTLSGRGARFEYVHIQDLMRRGQEIIASY
jgi:protoporphyrinogen oxidase